MLKSMTGFGRAFLLTDEVNLIVEIKSLNSRFLDIDIRLPKSFFDKEPDVRRRIAEKLQRGKIAVNIEYTAREESDVTLNYNETAFVAHYAQLKKLADRVMAPYDTIFQLALQAPQVSLEKKATTPDSEEWTQLEKYIYEAIDNCDRFRITEGRALHTKLSTYNQSIVYQLEKVESSQHHRRVRIENKIKEKIEIHYQKQAVDSSRMEQEILFFLERIAIDEELVRLKTHLSLFENTLENPISSGKKLTFITQEMGREINTIGSKANDIEIQKSVIAMKEELEKIKEQLSNVV